MLWHSKLFSWVIACVQVWENWTKGTKAEIVDPSLHYNNSSENEVLKCVNIGLLCVQENPGDRPGMSNVMLMLVGKSTTLPAPSRPAFLFRLNDENHAHGGLNNLLDGSNKSNSSVNMLTITVVMTYEVHIWNSSKREQIQTQHCWLIICVFLQLMGENLRFSMSLSFLMSLYYQISLSTVKELAQPIYWGRFRMEYLLFGFVAQNTRNWCNSLQLALIHHFTPLKCCS